ncbi:MAG: dTDP-4-dehydrorhamnose 3,5-epimerase family protein [Candidatus Methanofastidiosia archaeon]
MIHGVELKNLKLIPDERGFLVELLRSDWEIFEKFSQVYLTTAYPNVVKAWHYHKFQTDFFVCVRGIAKVVLYDSRENSESFREINEFHLGERNPLLLKIPPLVIHGFKAIGTKEAYILNFPTELYNHQNPDEYRLPPDTKEIPYEWNLMKGLKHG